MFYRDGIEKVVQAAVFGGLLIAAPTVWGKSANKGGVMTASLTTSAGAGSQAGPDKRSEDPCSSDYQPVHTEESSKVRSARKRLEKRLISNASTPVAFVAENGRWPGVVVDGDTPRNIPPATAGKLRFTRYSHHAYPMWQVSNLGTCKTVRMTVLLPVIGSEGNDAKARSRNARLLAADTTFTTSLEASRGKKSSLEDIEANGIVTVHQLAAPLVPGLNRIQFRASTGLIDGQVNRDRTIEIWYDGT